MVLLEKHHTSMYKNESFCPIIAPQIYYDSLPLLHFPYSIFLTRFHNFYSIFWLLEQFHSSLWNSVLTILKLPSQAWFSTPLLPSARD